jgi:hypothetical protein
MRNQEHWGFVVLWTLEAVHGAANIGSHLSTMFWASWSSTHTMHRRQALSHKTAIMNTTVFFNLEE